MSSNTPDPHNQPAPPPAYQPPAGSTAAGSYPPPPAGEPATGTKGPARLGIIAFVAALAAAVIGSVIAFIAGMQGGSLAQYADVTGGSTVDADSLPPEGQQLAISAGVLAFVAFAVWGILALWGLIQGIVAAVKNRGRGWGIAAIVIAVLGVGAVAIFYGVGVAAGIAPYVGG
jgi:hypothetical protein